MLSFSAFLAFECVCVGGGGGSGGGGVVYLFIYTIFISIIRVSQEQITLLHLIGRYMAFTSE